MSQDSSTLGSHAIVIGGSMAGLMTARVLADFFEKVTLVERDHFPTEAPAPRRGVPQCTQLHILLTRGRQIMEELFPGLETDLLEAGAAVLDMGGDVEWLNPFGWGLRFPSGFMAFSFSRYILDWLVYRRLQEINNIQVIENAYVKGLLTDEVQSNITGIIIRRRDSDNSQQVLHEKIFADFVVDASGYSSCVSQWLQAIGYNAPEEVAITTSMGYASRLYKIPDNFNADWKGIYIQAAPPERTSMGVLYPIEGNQWIVGICAVAPNQPTTDEAEFLEALKKLPSPLIYNAVKQAKPSTPIGIYRPPGNRWRHFEQLDRQPGRFIVLGDAVCSFTPIYGQGITVAALGVERLQQCLQDSKKEDLGHLPVLFQKELAKVISPAWIAATSQDAKYPRVKGAVKSLSLLEKAIGWYMDQLIRLTMTDSQISLALFNVFHMLQPSSTLFHPSVVFQVLKQQMTDSSPKEAA